MIHYSVEALESNAVNGNICVYIKQNRAVIKQRYLPIPGVSNIWPMGKIQPTDIGHLAHRVFHCNCHSHYIGASSKGINVTVA